MFKACGLFDGIGGFREAARITGGITFTKSVEIDPDARAVLQYHAPNIPIHDNIKNYHPRRGEFDLYTIGFPCTGTSNAGLRTGLLHPESALWFEALRCICEGRPQFVVIENPEGFIHNGLRAVLGGLRMAGYLWDNPQLISAAEFGAPHQRNRLFIVAYPNDLPQRFREAPTCWTEQIRKQLAEAHTKRRQAQLPSSWLDDGVPPWLCGVSVDGWWLKHSAPLYPGVRHHTPKRREACDLYSRSVCPEQAAIALSRVLYLDSLTKSPRTK